jgi:predicted GNAT family N-acyltransferase
MSLGAITPFHVERADYASALPDLRRVRDEVFVDEQGVPAELEHDEARDPLCVHVLARLDDGTPIGTGRLTPDCHIGRMAVRKPWRGRGVGDALLRALLDAAWLQGTDSVHLNAQVDAIEFYARHGFVAAGERFIEAGIEHQAMALSLDGPRAIRTRPMAIAATRHIIVDARRGLWIRSDALDPGLLDASPVLDALRTFATAGRGNQVRILLRDAAAPQHSHAPLLSLAQRLPSIFAFRELDDPADREDPSAFIGNDSGGYYLRRLGDPVEGEAAFDAAPRCRQLRASHDAAWERSRPVSEYRALGL